MHRADQNSSSNVAGRASALVALLLLSAGTVAASGGASVAATAPAGSTATTPESPAPVTLPADDVVRVDYPAEIADVRADPDGHVRMLVYRGGRRDAARHRGEASVVRSGDGRTPPTVQRIATGDRQHFFAVAGGALTARGASIAYVREGGASGRQVRIAATDRTRPASRLQRLTFPGNAYVEGADRGPDGAVVHVGVYDEHARGGSAEGRQPTWAALRPAGTDRFRRLDLSGVRGDVSDIALSPRGGGAILGSRSEGRGNWVRRISAAGRVGPERPIAVPGGIDAYPEAIVDSGGTLWIVLAAGRAADERHGLWLSRLAPSADRPTVPRFVPGSGDASTRDVVTLGRTGAGRVVMAAPWRAAGRSRGTTVYVEQGGALRSSDHVAEAFDVTPEIIGTPDGGWAFVWPTEGAGPGSRPGAAAVHCTAAGVCGALVNLVLGGVRGGQLEIATSAPGGVVLLGYTQASGDGSAAVGRVAPWW